MTLGDSIILSLGGAVSWDDSAALVAFAKAFEMLGPCSSYRKTHVGTMAHLELSLANSSVTSFFPRKICKYSIPSNYFLTCGAPGNIAAFYRPDMTTLCWPD
jgi:hypothetical protein